MTVIEKLREAIISQRWDIVTEVFQEFGGKLEEVKKKTKVKKKAIEEVEKDVISNERDNFLTHGLISEKNIEKVLNEPVIKRRSNDDFLAPIKNQNNRERDNSTGRTDDNGNEIRIAYSEPLDTSKSKINLWEDDLSVAIQDIEFNKKVTVKAPVNRQPRKDAIEIEASCKSCGRINKVLPMFAQHYRCDRCMVASR
jgi:hypothetical protein